MRSPHTEFNYIRISNFNAQLHVEIAQFDQFIGLLRRFNNAKPVYYFQNSKENRFLFYNSGLMTSLNGRGYKTLADFAEGQRLGFSQCNRKFEVDDKGDEHSHIEDKEKQPRIVINQVDQDDNRPYGEGELFYAVRKLGYSDMKEFELAMAKGFRSIPAATYREIIISKGFQDNGEYEESKKRGFEKAEEFRACKALGIRDKKTYSDYLFIIELQKKIGFGTVQEAHLYVILNRKVALRQQTLSTIWERLASEEPLSSRTWYTRKFESEKELEKYLIENEKIRALGIYDTYSKKFELFSSQRIIVDGSNIAYINAPIIDNNPSKKQPLAKNIKLVIESLRKLGFNNIYTICDASLYHTIDEKTSFAEFERLGRIHQSPTRSEADEFIIKYAKDFGARIISNDGFSDWKQKDEWVNKNIDKYRIGLMIIEDRVHFQQGINTIQPGDSIVAIPVSNFQGFANTSWRDNYYY